MIEKFFLLFIPSVIMTYALYLCVLFLENKKIKLINKKEIFVILIISIIFTIVNWFNLGLFKFIIVILVPAILNYVFVEKNIKKSLLISLVIYCAAFIFDIIVTKILLIFINGDYLINGKHFLLLKFIISIIESLVLCFCFKQRIIINGVNKIINILTRKSQKLIYLIVIIFFYIITNEVMFSLIKQNINIKYVFFLFTLFSLVVIWIQSLVYKQESLKDLNSNLIELNNHFAVVLEDEEIYRHNVRNELLTIKSIGDEKVIKLVDKYLKEKNPRTLLSKELLKIPNSLKGIMGNKLYNNKNTEILVLNELENDPFEKLNISNYKKLCLAIGITLDNAIEATNNLKKGYIYIYFSEKSDYYLIIIKNNFDNIVDLDQIGKRKYSTKKRGSGYGLYSILKINTINVKYTIIDNNFSVKISIKKPRTKTK